MNRPQSKLLLLAVFAAAYPWMAHASDTAPGASPSPAPITRSSSSPDVPAMVEFEAQLFYATDAQVRSALKSKIKPELTKENDGKLAPGFRGNLAFDKPDQAVELLTQAGAEFFSSPRIITRSGQSAKLEAVRELKYPERFEVDPKTSRVYPTEFAMKKVGVTVELEPVIVPEDVIQLSVSPSVVAFLGFIDYSKERPAAQYGQTGKPGQSGAIDGIQHSLETPVKSGGVWQPVFSNAKMTTNVCFYSGQTVLLGGMADPSLSQEERPRGGKGSKPKPSQPKRLLFTLITARTIHN